MTSQVQIEFLVDRRGNIRSTVKKARGPGCRDVAQSLQTGLGEVQETARTTEYYETAAVSCTRHITIRR